MARPAACLCQFPFRQNPTERHGEPRRTPARETRRRDARGTQRLWHLTAGNEQDCSLALRGTLPQFSDCKRHPEKWPRKEAAGALHAWHSPPDGRASAAFAPPRASVKAPPALPWGPSLPWTPVHPSPALPPWVLPHASAKAVFTPHLHGPFGLALCLSFSLRRVAERAAPE